MVELPPKVKVKLPVLVAVWGKGETTLPSRSGLTLVNCTYRVPDAPGPLLKRILLALGMALVGRGVLTGGDGLPLSTHLTFQICRFQGQLCILVG